MPNMQVKSVNLTNSLVVTMFRHTLFVSSLLWIGGVACLFLVVLLISRRIFSFNVLPQGDEEPRARTYLRWGFGAIWLIDGILQFQISMPLGLANNVMQP